MNNKEQLTKFWTDTINNYYNNLNNPLLFHDIFLPTKVHDLIDNTLYILVTDDFAKNQLEMNRLSLEEVFSRMSNKSFKLAFITKEEIPLVNSTNESNQQKELIKNEQKMFIESNLNFGNYVVGDFNRNAYKLITQILTTGQSLFNPIFIYSHTGLGKTHLISAFANEYIKRFDNKTLFYIDSSNFTKEILDALYKGSNDIEALKQRYSNYDVLMIDDVQYLSEKAKTNEIFFNIFNNLIRSQKIIIMTSDRAPDQLNGFEDRMISRFASGISINIKEPDKESLKSIIQNYISGKDIKLTDAAMNFILNYFNTDIRKLIGIINKLIFFISIENEPIIIDEKAIVNILDLENANITNKKKTLVINPNSVISAVSKLYNLKLQDIIGNSRKKEHTTARHIAMYILRVEYNFSFKEIGSLMNNRDHTTVINAVEKIKEQISKDKDLKEVITTLVKSL